MLVAIKVMKKSELVRKNHVAFILAEQNSCITIAKFFPNFHAVCCSMFSSFQSTLFFLCMEYAPGGDSGSAEEYWYA